MAIDPQDAATSGRSSRSSAARRPSSEIDVDAKRLKIEELDSIAARPTFWDDQKKAQGVLRDKKRLEQVVGVYDAQVRALADAEVLLELGEEAADEATIAEAATAAANVVKAFEDIEFRRMLSGQLDANGAIVQVASGAGGVDASDGPRCCCA